ncbi:MAG: hypothetical protein CVT89_04865 [Candidatus Altiarchaeales archaeon HGW-Altiarchaeales-2]|nr:MAG: hypothetical protein CVT89_04865 [Candidatus Altiarchaeales archaeon HGW-Altiarchaeales-2]
MEKSETDEIQKIFDFYRNYFILAYSDVVAAYATKPQQILTEIENTLSHIGQCFNPQLSDDKRKENAKKAYNHLLRATLNCYKLICVKQAKEIEKHEDNLYLKEKITKFKEFFKDARRAEMKEIGADNIVPIDKYKDAVQLGDEITNEIFLISKIKPKLFVGYKYTKKDEEIASKIIKILEFEGFECETGKSAGIGDIDTNIKSMLVNSDGCVIIFTEEKETTDGKFTTSPWLISEASYTFGKEKPVMILLEDGVPEDQIRGIQGRDYRYLSFNRAKTDDLILEFIPLVRDFHKGIIGRKRFLER